MGIELATFWLLAQCFNQLHHCVPPAHGVVGIKDGCKI
jgi:hypothetical protein